MTKEALPFVLWAACPVAMLVMMKGMHGAQAEDQNTPRPGGDDAGMRREEQLGRMRAQQEVLSDRIDALEPKEPGALPERRS